jgi:hypothetical protein
VSDYTIDPERYADIELKQGNHDTRADGMCLMEAVAYLVGEEHTDHPKCVDQVLGSYGRALNDTLPTTRRQELLALIPSLPGTAGEGKEYVRSVMAHRWLYRHWLPTVLDTSMAGWAHHLARRLRDLNDPIVYADTCIQLERYGIAPQPTRYHYDETSASIRITAPRQPNAEEHVVRATVVAWGLTRTSDLIPMRRWLTCGPSSLFKALHDTAFPAIAAVSYSDPGFRNRDDAGWNLVQTVLDLALTSNTAVRAEAHGIPLMETDKARHAEVLDGLRTSSIELYATMMKSPEMPR